MKKFLLCLAALVMLLTASALADTTVVKTTEIEGSISLCLYSGNYISRDKDGYRLYDANGNALSDVYQSMSPMESGKYLKVQNVSSSVNVNCQGLLDAQGNLIMPLQYGSIITYYAQDWVFAHVLEPAGGDVGEYSDSKGNKYIISRTDVLHDGKGFHLDREDFKGSYRVTDQGPSVFVRISDHEGYWLFYMDGTFNRHSVTDDSYVDTSEFSSGYNSPVIHNPTGWQAFTASCTLTNDQVEQHVWYDDRSKCFLDLQGNVLAENVDVYAARYHGNYFEVRKDMDNRGVMSFDGKMVIPAQYEDIAPYFGSYFASGYTAAVDQKGNLYYYDEAGNVTASAEYQMDANDYKGFNNNAPIVHVKNMGKYMIITATHGTLAETYEDVLTCGENQKVIRVKKDGKWGVIDMAGNTVVPFEYDSSADISEDGTLILCKKDYNLYVLYQLSYDAAAQAPAAEAAPAAETEAPVAAEGSWVCSCGAANDGKFCAECGSKKPEPTPTPAPADDGSWECSCGARNTTKFCPECGSKKPEDPQCQNCGYKPEGAAPKFCPECGTKF